jgi:hypothetical protein
MRVRVVGLVIIGAAILAFVGSFLPWAQALGGLLKANGTDGDGVITLAVALIGGGFGLGVTFGKKRRTARWTGLGACLCGVIIGAVAGFDLNDLNRLIGEMELENEQLGPEAGSGIYLTLASGVVMALASEWAIFTSDDLATVSQP